MIEGIGALDKGLRFVEVLRDSPGHGSNDLHSSFLRTDYNSTERHLLLHHTKPFLRAALRIISKKKEDGLEK